MLKDFPLAFGELVDVCWDGVDVLWMVEKYCWLFLLQFREKEGGCLYNLSGIVWDFVKISGNELWLIFIDDLVFNFNKKINKYKKLMKIK